MRSAFLTSHGGGSVSFARPPRRYPAQALANVEVIGILNALKVAWGVMTRHGPPHDPKATLGWDDENAVTDSLAETLNLLRSARVLEYFTSDRFDDVVVDAVFRNYNGEKLRKRPDLTFRVRDSTGDVHGGERAFFVEAKIIDGKNRQVSHYIRNGVRRYVDGEYAWAMPHGLMIAYVLNEQTLPDALNDQLFGPIAATLPRCTPLGPAVVPRYLARLPDVEDVHCTVHGRNFAVGETAAEEIELLHLWMRCPRS